MVFIVRERIPLYRYTTLKVGGEAKYFAEVKTVEDLEKASQFAKQTDLPFLVIGGGSNLLVSDEGYSGLVIHNQLKGRTYIENSDNSVTLICQAGEVLDEVVKESIERELWGLENLSSIPGTVGATPVQNVGAYGVEVGDLIIGVETYNVATGNRHFLKQEECGFGYRDSIFKTVEGKKHIITAVHFRLGTKPNPKINYADLAKIFTDYKPSQKEIREAIVAVRAKKFPNWHEVGTAGSFFKNPLISNEQATELLVRYPELPVYKTRDGQMKVSLGYVLDKICHLKGYREGNISLYTEQALVLVNYGEKNSDEIKSFVNKIIEKVFMETKITIVPEVCFIE